MFSVNLNGLSGVCIPGEAGLVIASPRIERLWYFLKSD